MLSDARIDEIRAKHRPRGVIVRYKQRHIWTRERRLANRSPFTPASAQRLRDGTLEVYCADAKRFTRDLHRRIALATELHEYGHFRCGRGHIRPHDMPRHQFEFEAERWSENVMRIEGVRVPKTCLASARHYIRQLIAADTRLGYDILPQARAWSRGFDK